LSSTCRFDTQEPNDFQFLWEDGERVFRRGWRVGSNGSRDAVLAVLPGAEHPTATVLARLAHEYRLKDELDGAWAVRPLELLRERGRTILVLEDHGAEPLEHLLGRPMELGTFLQLAVALSASLRRVHERGLIHKDIKPANVLVDAAGEVRLTGFGIATRLPRERQAPDPPEVIGGTLAYMAPEQTGRMNRSIDARSDLYALGVTFYRMLTGSLPFSASDPMEWVHCHIARHPAPPNERVNTIPDSIAALVLKLLAKDAEGRYQTAAGVESDLRQCLSEWKAHGRIERFPLGGRDASDRLLIPEKLYGRDSEIGSLFAAFDRVVTDGVTEIALISGYAGVGKSSVVNELQKALVPPRGLFASGKFDQYKRDIPYATLAQAFQSLVRQLLGKSDEEISRWRGHLLEAAGSNGQLMVNLIPELALIIGEQQPVPELPPQEGQNRFLRIFRRFLGVFARQEHPLVLFLDDLQWLDTATLEMIEHLATHCEVRHLLLVGAYRDNEVGPSHPLRRILQAIRGAGGRVQETVLAPLQHDAFEQMVADSLHCDREGVRPLAWLIHQKTEGNPFFAIQFFTALSEEGLLQFDHGRTAWSWDLSRIRAKGFSENVVDLMAVKLGRLSGTTQNALGQLACLGNVAAIATLAMIQSEPEEKIHASLWEAVLAGLILRVNGTYKFFHDRVQEAAYSLIPESERAAAHLRIGRVLAAGTAPGALEDVIFDIVNHLNRGVSLIETQDERAHAAMLNLMAGKRAKSSTAYASARNYLAQAAALLRPDAWRHRYDETFELYLLLSECEYLSGNFEAADALFDIILNRATSELNRAKVHSLRMRLYAVAGKYDEGLVVALNALRSFGVTFPSSDQDIEAAVEAQFRDIPINLAGRPIGKLLDAAVAADPVKRAIIDLLVDMVPPAYIARPPLFPLVTLEAVNRSMRDGNTDQSSFAYAVFALMLISLAGDIDSAYQFSDMSLRLNERFSNARLRGTLLHLHGDHVNFWRRPFSTGLPILEQAFAACLEVGDLVYAGFLAFETVWQLIEKGDVLDDVLSSSARYAAFAQQSRNDPVYETIRLEQRFVASLQGRTRGPLTLGDDTFDEAASLAVSVKAAFGCGVVFYHIMKQMLAVIYGRCADAMEAAAKAEPVLGAAMAMPIEATYHFCHALTLTALYTTASKAQQQQYRSLLDEKLKKLRLWADNCPENYRGRHALVLAEIARIEGRDGDAMRLYEEAVHSAHENSLLHNEAIASELAGRFYLAIGLETNGYAHLRNARACFALWGADGKVAQLDSRYPRLAAAEGRPRAEAMDAAIQKIDVKAVLKASQVVSGEIELPKLIERLMTVALESAGADRGLLILPHKDDYLVAALAEVSSGEIAVHRAPLAGHAVPNSLIRYVTRTHDSVILDDATRPSPFAADEYFIRQRPRSVFCLPLVRQTKLAGILYLENMLASHVFTPDRTALLGLLASQLAISLENTSLYSNLREREARIRRLVDANIIGIFIFDLEGRIIEANDAFLRMVGYDRDDFVSGRVRWTDLTPPEWRDRHARAIAELKVAGTVQPYEREYFRKDGSRVPALIGSAQFEEGGNEGAAFVLDLTERRRGAETLREVQAELAHASRVATMGQLTASIAHEVTQPIAAVTTNAQGALRWLCRQPPDLEQVQQSLTRIVKNSTRAGDVINRIRELIKKAPPRKDRVDINEAIREVIELAHGEVVKNHVAVETNLADGLPLIEGDRVQLQQVMLNLIINAIEAMSGVDDERRDLHISTRQGEPSGVLVGVRDSGPGLGSGDPERVFATFYSTKPGGLGMGLSICRSIIETHGGRMWATANAPRGAIFQFTVDAYPGSVS
jgi:PAS domain S-box-containing protein